MHARLRSRGGPHSRQREQNGGSQRQDQKRIAPGQPERTERPAGVGHRENHARDDEKRQEYDTDEYPAAPVELPICAGGHLVVLAPWPLFERFHLDGVVAHPARRRGLARRTRYHIRRFGGRATKNDAACFIPGGRTSGMPDRRTDGGDHADHTDHDHHGHTDHAVHAHEHDFGPVGVAVVTVSTSRTLDEDPAGDAIAAAVEAAGDEVSTRELIGDDYDGIQGRVGTFVGREDVDVVVTTGGTGVTPDDVTIEAVSPLFGKDLPGFGELFRRYSEDDIGTRVVATRAMGGIVDGVPVFCLPGSEDAARLGADIVTEEAAHLAGLAVRDAGENESDENEDGPERDESGEGNDGA